MESKILDQLIGSTKALNLIEPFDGRGKLAINPNGRKYKIRDHKLLKGMVWHQELGWGSVEAVASYHTGKYSHLAKGGVEAIAYTFAIRRNGQIVLCNDFKKTTWSQGYIGRRGDENAEFMSVMFEGMFQGVAITDSSAGEPNDLQLSAGLILWHVCKSLWKWNEADLYGHFHFGKPSCPGKTLQTMIEAIRHNIQHKDYNFKSVKNRQQALKELDYYKAKVDGIWGPMSRAALIQFQIENHFAADGLWGPRTESKIVKVLRAK